jgi:tRNA/rRNA methyltransferase
VNPIIILVDPQMGENIGASARAMLNCSFNTMRLVRPRDGWPNTAAEATASGALSELEVEVYKRTEDAIADCNYIIATTARTRDMIKPIHSAKSAAIELYEKNTAGNKTAILFGAERTGLTNHDLSLAHAYINIPLNPEFTSLNLGQAVLLVCYEYFQMKTLPMNLKTIPTGKSQFASHEELNTLFMRLEEELELHHFFRNPDQKPSMVINIRNMMARAELTDQEVRTFHGIISALTGKKSSQL